MFKGRPRLQLRFIVSFLWSDIYVLQEYQKNVHTWRRIATIHGLYLVSVSHRNTILILGLYREKGEALRGEHVERRLGNSPELRRGNLPG